MTRSVPGEPRHRGALRFGLVAAAIALLAAPAAASAAPALHPCADGQRWRCGTLSRPLDPARPGGRKIGIAFRWLPPRHAGAHHPALVAVEGGPGYPSTGSRVEYTGIYGPLLRDARAAAGGQPRDGRLGADRLPEASEVLRRDLGRGGSRASWPAARARSSAATARPDLFATAYAARDLAAVIRALRLGRGRPVRRLLRHILRAVVHRRATRGCCTRWCWTPPIRCAASTRGTCPPGRWRATRSTRSARATRAARRSRPAARRSASAQLLARLRHGRDRGTRARRRRSPRARALRRARAGRPRAGRRLRAAHLPRARPRGARGARPATTAPLLRLVAESRPLASTAAAATPPTTPTGSTGRSPARTTRSCSRWTRRPPTGAAARGEPAGAAGRRVRPVHRARVGHGGQLHAAVQGLPRLAAPAPGGAGGARRRRGRCRPRSRC